MVDSLILHKFKVKNEIDYVLNQNIVSKNQKLSPIFKNTFVKLCNEVCPLFSNYFDYKKYLKESGESVEYTTASLKQSISKLRKRLFFNKYSYNVVLFFEILLLCKEMEFTISENKFEFLCSCCFIPKNKTDIKLYEDKNPMIKSFLSFLDNEKIYSSKRIFNIAVCANVSAGKSTFVNALLGKSFLPSRNSPTTQTITTVIDKDLSLHDYVILKKYNSDNLFLQTNDICLKDIQEWNNDSSISQIFIQSDLDDISNKNGIVVVNDTPGTNNSCDKSHAEITFDFLANNDMDLILFVSDYSHIMVTDEEQLLKQLLEINKKNHCKIIFVLNKIDILNIDEEDYTDVEKEYCEYLEKLGFDKPLIYPVSSSAARFFKMALRGNHSFSESEQNNFDIYYKKFTKLLSLNKLDLVYEEDGKQINITNNTYDCCEIKKALLRTGMIDIENKIEELVTDTYK